MEQKESNGKCKSLNACPSLKRVEIENDAHLKNYIIWENKSNVCWLDASLALVAHNKVMKRYSGVSPECRISKIISAYDDVITILNNSDKNINQKINLAKVKLNYIQESTLQYLRPILKYKTGDPESAFCSLYNLLIQDSVMKRIFDVTWISVKECTNCGLLSESTKSKPIITLSKIDSFDPENPAIIYHCACKKLNQKIKLVYVSLPPCLIFHFENGAGEGKPPLSFITREREYHLTGIMTLEKSQDSVINHFITWIRDPFVDKWLDCNDLNLDIISFSPDYPDIKFHDVYIYVYESFDDLGTITDSKIVNTQKSEENIPCFDLSEESDSENNNSQNTATESKKDTEEMKASESNLKPSSDNNTSSESDKDKSLERAVSSDNKNIYDKTDHVKIHENQMEPIDDKVCSENVKTNNDGRLKTSLNVNMTSTDNNDGKELKENICKSDCSEHNVETTKISHENSCSLPSVKETLKENKVSSIEDRHENSEVNYKTSIVISETSFDEERGQNFLMNAACYVKNIQNEELLSKTVCSKTLDEQPETPKKLGSAKIKDMNQTKHDAKKNFLEEDMDCSEQLFANSNTGQNSNERLALNSNEEQLIHSEHFLQHAVANSSGTSYVKVSLRKKKNPSHLIYKKDCVNDTNNPHLDERICNMIFGVPSSLQSLKRKKEAKQEMDEDSDYVPSETPKKKKQLVQMNTVISTGNSQHPETKTLKTELKKKSQVKSKLKHVASKKALYNDSSVNAKKQGKNSENHYKSDSEQGSSQSGAINGAKNSNTKSSNEGKILKDFEDVWSCHKSGCNCELASFDETIDTVVDYTFAYLCKLSQEFKKSNNH